MVLWGCQCYFKSKLTLMYSMGQQTTITAWLLYTNKIKANILANAKMNICHLAICPARSQKKP